MIIKPDPTFTLIKNSWILLGLILLPHAFPIFILYFSLKYSIAYFTTCKISENGIMISEGFISKNTISILKVKINSIQVTQSVLQKYFGIGTVTIMMGNDSVTKIIDIKLDTFNKEIIEQKYQDFILS